MTREDLLDSLTTLQREEACLWSLYWDALEPADFPEQIESLHERIQALREELDRV